ncbi:cob(I)yrinic acid a,c-diamide adenosyltransferase [Paenibacillus spiritus]|uniref:Corrinoid adenosyltransferase n=1 Tax=Paenibacillus spiritus TaxID=2496557 RepID=A0A5J5GB37_9BACL|nr:cob(I)yrinic acid a,c-diamide adenosyltransferase [Paenibacillus spiritus]KAA9005329.1 cob(I)yrinic acid a,c-diamide adenosyltransferase [Paenibacillus spiritus]
MAIYTRSGDRGETSVIGGRVSKDDARVEAYGTIDELNSLVGQAHSLADSEHFADLRQQLLEIQHELFDCGSDLAYAKPEDSGMTPKVTSALVERLEKWIDALQAENPPLEKFILPGGTLLSSTMHVCRTVCRRAERRTITLARETAVPPESIRYLNRLSDYFFAAARTANVRSGVADVEYVRGSRVFRN